MSSLKASSARIFDFSSALPPTIYWDASFLVHSIHDRGIWHAECVAFGARLDASETISYVSTLALDETWFTLLQLFIASDYPERSFWRVVNDDHRVTGNYIDRLETITATIYANPKIRVIGVTARAPRLALKNMREFHLLPRDALHLATMRQHRLTSLVTTDADFVPARDFSIYSCNPALF